VFTALSVAHDNPLRSVVNSQSAIICGRRVEVGLVAAGEVVCAYGKERLGALVPRDIQHAREARTYADLGASVFLEHLSRSLVAGL
jgi:hypothetical protein